MSKFIKVNAWGEFLNDGPQQFIINVENVTFVKAYKVDDDLGGVRLTFKGTSRIHLKMSIDECLEMLNGAKDG